MHVKRHSLSEALKHAFLAGACKDRPEYYARVTTTTTTKSKALAAHDTRFHVTCLKPLTVGSLCRMFIKLLQWSIARRSPSALQDQRCVQLIRYFADTVSTGAPHLSSGSVAGNRHLFGAKLLEELWISILSWVFQLF